jgi:hypothetical protein
LILDWCQKKKIKKYKYEFVRFIPDKIEDGIVYISIEYNAMSHKCACGCGNEVITPIFPSGWSLTYDGKTISINPSIGNFSFPCKSHYFINKSTVVWARKYDKKLIEKARYFDEKQRLAYYEDHLSSDDSYQIISKALLDNIE